MHSFQVFLEDIDGEPKRLKRFTLRA